MRVPLIDPRYAAGRAALACAAVVIPRNTWLAHLIRFELTLPM